jgi:TrmH family RNA methyltransferase
VTKTEVLSQRVAKLARRLADPRGRVQEGLVLVEGVRCAATALDAAAPVRLALVSPRLIERPEGPGLLDRLNQEHVDVRRVSDAELEGVADTRTPQGILLVCEERDADLAALEPGRWLVMDAVQDPGNAGTLLRAAAAFGLDGVVALEGTVDLWSAKAVRASAGLIYAVPVVRTRAEELVDTCTALGIAILVADAAGADASGVRVPGPLALVVGNEGAGVRPELRAAGRPVAVPMRGGAESLNVGMAGSILLYVLTRENQFD